MLTSIAAVLGFGLVLYFVYKLFSDFGSFARVQTAKDFAVPLALSVLFFPFIYGALLYATYERMFGLVGLYVKDAKLSRFMKRLLLIQYNINARGLEDCRKRLPSSNFTSKQEVMAFLGEKPRPKSSAPRGCRDLMWGEPPNENLRPYSSGAVGDNVSLYVPRTEPPAMFLGTRPAEEIYSYSENKLYSAMLFFDGVDAFKQLRRELAALYGPLHFANEARNLWKWTWPEAGVEVQFWYEPKYARATLHLTNKNI